MGNSIAIMMADIDHFKQVNDTYGHPAGDIVLRETARKLVESVRPYDSVGRYGGEEPRDAIEKSSIMTTKS